METLQLLRLQNTEVFVGLVGGQSAAQAGDTSKYFSQTTNGEAERIYVDRCTSTPTTLFSVGNLQSYIQHAVEGGTSAVFLSGAGITRQGDYDRRQFMADFCQAINQSMGQVDPDMSMTYAFVGVTDGKVVDFHRDRMVSPEKLAHGLGALQHEVDDWERVEEKVLRGATLPFVLSLHFESLRGTPTNGHLCLADLGLVSWAQHGESDPLPGMHLQQSTQSLARLVHLLANDGILTGATIPGSALGSLTGEFLAGESKTAFVVYLNTDDAAELKPAVDLMQSVRKLKSREIVRAVDRRVLFFYEKAKYYQGEKYRMQDELADVQEEKEQADKDLDDIQRDFGEEREALAKEVEHWQQKSKQLQQALDSLRSESAGLEADARWENARLVTEKLAIKDELRRAEIEMAAAEDSKSKLLDLYEGLQGSYDSLDAVYGELLAAYRLVKDRYGQLADERADLQQKTAGLEATADQHIKHIARLKAEASAAASSHAEQTEAAEQRHGQEAEALETQLAEATLRGRELQAKATQLETANKSLTMSQTEEVAGLQASVAELSAQLEESERRASSEAATLTGSLRASEKAVKRLQAEKAKAQRQADEAAAHGEAQAESEERQAQWDRERDQLQRQIRRLQQSADSSQRREAELRDESERQWQAWEDEKHKAHEKYLALKSRFRQAVDFAANVQVKLDSERDAAPAADADDPPAAVSPPAKPRRKAPAKRTKPPVKAAAAPELQVPRPRRSAARKAPAAYAESADDDDDEGQPAAAALGGMACNTSDASDDSEISFNPQTAIRPEPADEPADEPAAVPEPAPKRTRRTVRPKKSVQELNAELTTQPARKRQPAAHSNGSSSAPASEPEPPKRKRAAARAPKSRVTEEEPAAREEPAAADASTGIGSATTALKKKRKLNLSRMRSLLGISGSRPGTEASSSQAIKFAVPKIRSTATAAPSADDSD
ncbi:hypothetical protein GGF46_002927 [Coemansia sp. RSA 552]|nr:hypothetical protein GGF46_002927 [Coemansia sp. RSA 552]